VDGGREDGREGVPVREGEVRMGEEKTGKSGKTDWDLAFLVFFGLLHFCSMAFAFCLMSAHSAREHERNEAIKAGVAGWEHDEGTGGPVFRYRERK